MKVGGNIVSYVCTPNGRVIHALPAALPPAVFKKELQWAVAVYIKAGGKPAGVAAAHRVRQKHVPKWANGYQYTLNPVHKILETQPLVKVEEIERQVFETILGQTYSPDAPISYQEMAWKDLLQTGAIGRG